MKITDIRIHQPIGLLRIGTDEGIEGCCLGVDENTARHIQSSYRDFLIGQDPFDRQAIWEELSRRDRFQYLPQPVRGHVDVAVWDLLGKATDLPVFRLIGGFRDSIPAYKMGPNFDTVERFVAEAVQAKEEGFFGYKDHFRDKPPEMMMEVARESRRAVGPDFHLMHDAVQQYVFTDALRVGRVLQEEEYFWFEEPLRDYDLMGLKKLAAALDIPIAATEYLPGTIYSTSQLVAQQAVDIVRASVPWRGGITDMLMIARLAEAFGMSCEITSRGSDARVRSRPRHRRHKELHLLRNHDDRIPGRRAPDPQPAPGRERPPAGAPGTRARRRVRLGRGGKADGVGAVRTGPCRDFRSRNPEAANRLGPPRRNPEQGKPAQAPGFQNGPSDRGSNPCTEWSSPRRILPAPALFVF